MRLGTILTALIFLAVALAAGMWPSWSLASSLGISPRPATVSVEAPAAVEHSAYKPCYSAVRIAAVSCMVQLGLPESTSACGWANIRHGIPTAQSHAVKMVTGDSEFRPPRPLPGA